MKTRLTRTLAAAIAVVAATSLAGSIKADGVGASVGSAAPVFSTSDTRGADRSLADFAGKYVVLEWINHGCPFVRKHYSSGNMQALQQKYTEKGVVWLSIASSAPGKQGHFTAEEWNTIIEEKKSSATAVLLDADGTIGRAYGARTTPQMVIIDPKGTIIYAGAIDDKPSADVDDIATARNHVAAALDEALAGKPVSVATSQPYGCSVKY
jgi:peroxiredoxin